MTIPVIILSLQDAFDRRAALLTTLDAHGVLYEIWNAVDGRNGLTLEHEHLIDRAATLKNLGRPMGNAEYGCALSHHLIYRAILERASDLTIILEDDAIVGEEFFNFVKTIRKPNYDLLLLDHEGALVSCADRIRIDDKAVAYRCRSQPDRTTGYCVTRRGAAKLAGNSLPIRGLADWPLDLNRMRAYAVTPRIVDHPDPEIANSDIEREREQLQLRTIKNRKKPWRILQAEYWRRKYYKRFGKWIS